MSVASVVARVQELQQLIGGRPQTPAQAPDKSAKGADFAATLAQAAVRPGAPPTGGVPGAAVPGQPGAATPAGLSMPGGATLPVGMAPGGPAAVGAPVSGGVSGIPYADQINAAAAKHKLDPALLAGLIRQESNFNANAVSPAGARGLTQLMPGTAQGLGVSDPTDPAQAIEGGAKYLRQQLDRFGNDPTRALAAYNAGPGAVVRHGGVPPYAETQAYVRKVQAFADAYRQAGAPATAAVAAPAVAASFAASPFAAPAVAAPIPAPSFASAGGASSSGLGYSTR